MTSAAAAAPATPDSPPRPRIIVLFGNIPLLGQERGNINALASLRDSGCEVLFLIRRDRTKDTIQAELDRRGLAWIAVPHYYAMRRGQGLGVWLRNLHGILGGSWQLLRHARRFRATHLHAANPEHVLNFLPALAWLKTPLIYRMGDQVISHHWLWRMVWRFTRYRAARFAALNRYIAGLLAESGVAQDKIRRVSNIPMPRSAEWAVEGRTYLADGACTFLYSGQIAEHKGVEVFLEAAISCCQESENCRFLLAGDFKWQNEFAGKLISRISRLDLASRIVFLGYVEDVAALLAWVDVHVCPSLWDEPFGNVVIDAKAQGVLSVVFDSGGLAELVRHGEDGWICSEKSEDALREAFAFYQQHPAEIAAQGQAARQSLPRLGLGEFASDWLKLYESVP